METGADLVLMVDAPVGLVNIVVLAEAEVMATMLVALMVVLAGFARNRSWNASLVLVDLASQLGPEALH